MSSKFSNIFIIVAALDEAEPKPAWKGKFFEIENNNFGGSFFKNLKSFFTIQSSNILFFGAKAPE